MEKRHRQSAPRDCSRGDSATIAPASAFCCFNPRPVIAHGATYSDGVRVPVRIWFQSAPRDCSRGDGAINNGGAITNCFNPRPVIAHGATGGPKPLDVPKGVSIRAP